MRQVRIFSGEPLNAEKGANEFLRVLDQRGRNDTAKVYFSGTAADAMVLVEYDFFEGESSNLVIQESNETE